MLVLFRAGWISELCRIKIYFYRQDDELENIVYTAQLPGDYLKKIMGFVFKQKA